MPEFGKFFGNFRLFMHTSAGEMPKYHPDFPSGGFLETAAKKGVGVVREDPPYRGAFEIAPSEGGYGGFVLGFGILRCHRGGFFIENINKDASAAPHSPKDQNERKYMNK